MEIFLSPENTGKIKELVVRAGREILSLYTGGQYWRGEKADQSPITEADKKSHQLILEGLGPLSEYPVVSEEDELPRPEMDFSQPFWLLDPLDGTKHFLEGDGEFVVSLGLVTQNRALAGFIYAPVFDQLFWALRGQGAYLWDKPIENTHPKTQFVGFFKGGNREPLDFLSSLGVTEFRSMGSALKFCRIAEGCVDIYPHFGPSWEWDVAGAHCILEEAGCLLLDVESRQAMGYGKKDFFNRGFLACRGDFDLVSPMGIDP